MILTTLKNRGHTIYTKSNSTVVFYHGHWQQIQFNCLPKSRQASRAIGMRGNPWKRLGWSSRPKCLRGTDISHVLKKIVLGAWATRAHGGASPTYFQTMGLACQPHSVTVEFGVGPKIKKKCYARLCITIWTVGF